MDSATFSSPIGNLHIVTEGDQLIRIDFLSSLKQKARTPIAKETILQLQHYFKNPQFCFSLPYQIQGSDFQLKVLKALSSIESGVTKSYGELALELRTGARAIGNACRRNPIPIIIPCHRIISQNSVGGFAGARKGKLLEIKQWLLHHESRQYA